MGVGSSAQSGGQPLLEAAGIEPAPGGAKLPAESRPYLVTARNTWGSSSRRIPPCTAPFQVIPQAPATYVQHDGELLACSVSRIRPVRKDRTFPMVRMWVLHGSQNLSVRGQASCHFLPNIGGPRRTLVVAKGKSGGFSRTYEGRWLAENPSTASVDGASVTTKPTEGSARPYTPSTHPKSVKLELSIVIHVVLECRVCSVLPTNGQTRGDYQANVTAKVNPRVDCAH